MKVRWCFSDYLAQRTCQSQLSIMMSEHCFYSITKNNFILKTNTWNYINVTETTVNDRNYLWKKEMLSVIELFSWSRVPLNNMGRWGLWAILGPATGGRSRRFDFTFEGLCGTLGSWSSDVIDQKNNSSGGGHAHQRSDDQSQHSFNRIAAGGVAFWRNEWNNDRLNWDFQQAYFSLSWI